MILVVPSIDMKDGRCIRCIHGEPGTEVLYHNMSEHASVLARLWRRENAKVIQVTDHDSMSGSDATVTFRTVVEVQRKVDIPIQFVTSTQDIHAIRKLLEDGVYRVGISTPVVSNPEGVRELVRDFGPSRVVFGIRAENGVVSCGGLVAPMSDEEFIECVRNLGGNRIIYSDASWEGNLAGEDLSVLRRILDIASPMRVTAAGGISRASDLWELNSMAGLGVDSVVVGRALYENVFPCQKIWRQIEARVESDFDDESDIQSSISQL